jgi:hypothetical protein
LFAAQTASHIAFITWRKHLPRPMRANVAMALRRIVAGDRQLACVGDLDLHGFRQQAELGCIVNRSESGRLHVMCKIRQNRESVR